MQFKKMNEAPAQRLDSNLEEQQHINLAAVKCT